jgi:hypothetical protein
MTEEYLEGNPAADPAELSQTMTLDRIVYTNPPVMVTSHIPIMYIL